MCAHEHRPTVYSAFHYSEGALFLFTSFCARKTVHSMFKEVDKHERKHAINRLIDGTRWFVCMCMCVLECWSACVVLASSLTPVVWSYDAIAEAIYLVLRFDITLRMYFYCSALPWHGYFIVRLVSSVFSSIFHFCILSFVIKTLQRKLIKILCWFNFSFFYDFTNSITKWCQCNGTQALKHRFYIHTNANKHKTVAANIWR